MTDKPNYLSDLVCGQEIFGHKKANPPEQAIHVAFGVDRAFVRGMGVAIASLLANNPQLDFVFHIGARFLPAEDLRRIRELAGEKSTINVYQINDELLRCFPTFEHLSVAMYYRIILAEILAEKTKKLLYLDADVLCLQSIDELLDMDFADNIVCAVPEDHQARVRWLQLKQNRYFNSGMLYIDLEKWSQGNCAQKVLACINDRLEQFTLPDQDALNVVLDGRVKFLAPCWNYFYNSEHQTESVPRDTVFLHFFGAIKPWEVVFRHQVKNHFLKYEQQSPWAQIAPAEPLTASKMELYVRMLWQEQKYKAALLWYGKYIHEKFL